MAETQNATTSGEFESRIAALEKSIAELRKMLRGNAEKYDAIGADVSAALGNTARIAEMMAEVLPLIRRAAPLLDSPMAKLANSPAAGVMSLFGGGRRG